MKNGQRKATWLFRAVKVNKIAIASKSVKDQLLQKEQTRKEERTKNEARKEQYTFVNKQTDLLNFFYIFLLVVLQPVTQNWFKKIMITIFC